MAREGGEGGGRGGGVGLITCFYSHATIFPPLNSSDYPLMSDDEAPHPPEEHFGGTVHEALDALGITSPLVLGYFVRHGLSRERLGSQIRFSNQGIYQKLNQGYRKSLFGFHTDKGGSGDAEGLHRIKKVWEMLKPLHSEAITVDSSSEASDNESEASDNESEGGNNNLSASNENQQAGQEEDEQDIQQETSQSAAHATRHRDNSHEQEAESAQHLIAATPMGPGGDHPNPNAQYIHFIGKEVTQKFWFIAKITNARLSEEGILYHLDYEDGDEEDLTSEELAGLPVEKDAELECGFLGATIWKQFELNGQVTGCRVGETLFLLTKRLRLLLLTPLHSIS